MQRGDHYHEVPISETEVLTPNDKSAAILKTVKGRSTYHAKLLETNPVKALRLQAEERGHWSKDHIPPFPPSDTEAQEFAKNIYIYIVIHYESIEDESNPISVDAVRAYLSQMRAMYE